MGKAGDKDTSSELISAIRDLTLAVQLESLRGGTRGALVRAPQQQGWIRISPSPKSPIKSPISKLTGKAWVEAAYNRRADELLAMGITNAGRALSNESKDAPDCKQPLVSRYVERQLRDLGVFPKKPR